MKLKKLARSALLEQIAMKQLLYSPNSSLVLQAIIVLLEELVNQYYAQLELIDHPLEVLLCLIV